MGGRRNGEGGRRHGKAASSSALRRGRSGLGHQYMLQPGSVQALLAATSARSLSMVCRLAEKEETRAPPRKVWNQGSE